MTAVADRLGAQLGNRSSEASTASAGDSGAVGSHSSEVEAQSMAEAGDWLLTGSR